MSTAERGMVLADWEVRGFLDGTRSMLARPVDPQLPSYIKEHLKTGFREMRPAYFDSLWGAFAVHGTAAACHTSDMIECPFGDPGERLWIAENFWLDTRKGDHVIFEATPEYGKYRGDLQDTRIAYPDGSQPSREECRRNVESNKFWALHGAIRMQRWASRITLSLNWIQCVRIQDITESDIIAEGVTVNRVAEWTKAYWSDMPTLHDARRVLWDEQFPEHPWESNPWIWLGSFGRVEAS